MIDNDLPAFSYYDDLPQSIKDDLVEIDTDSTLWMTLYHAASSGQLWAIDVWDKYTWRVAFRVTDRLNWHKIDFTDKRKALLLKSRGGLSQNICIWQNCTNLAVIGVVYCLDHLYETGARK